MYNRLFPIGIYWLKIYNKNTRKRCKLCPKLTKKYTRKISTDMNTQFIDVFLFKSEDILLPTQLFL